jgi:hypothetical protein
MNTNFKKIAIAFMLLFFTLQTNAQLSPISFEPGANGNAWTWTAFENLTNLPPQIVANPSSTGINTSATAIQMTPLVAGKPWAGFESFHGAGIGTFTLNSTNCIVKVMVYKSVISDVGVKFATAAGASTGEIKVPNTLINQWEELTFNFTGKIGEPSSTNIDQIIIFPDFTARTTDNICYVDNITLGTGTPTQNINVKFAVQGKDSLPVSVFGIWNNWGNFPGTPMTWNASTASYEATLPMVAGSTIEYLFVNGNGASAKKEILQATMPCTNGNATYTNRIKILGTTDITLCNVFKTCNTCIPAAIDDFKSDNFSIFLNTNYCTIQSVKNTSIDKIEIFDLFGKKCFETNQAVATNQNIPVKLLSNTIYLVRIQKENQFINLKTKF